MPLETEIATDGDEVGIEEVTSTLVVTVGIARRIEIETETEKRSEIGTGTTGDLIPAAPIRDTMTGGLPIEVMPMGPRRTESLTGKKESACLYFFFPVNYISNDFLNSRISPRREHSRAPSSSYTSTPRRPDHDPDFPKQPMEAQPSPTKPQLLPPEPEPELELNVPEEEPSLDEQIAARRAKRAAILAKYAASVTSTSHSIPCSPERNTTPSMSVQPLVRDLTLEDPSGRHESPCVNHEADTVDNALVASRSASPLTHPNGENDFSLTKEGAEEESAVEAGTRAPGDGEQISAADYDPSLDRREDEQRRARGMGMKTEPQEVCMDLVEEVIEEEEDEDVDDMFAIITSKAKTKKKVRVATVCYTVFHMRASIDIIPYKSTVKPLITTTTLDSAADPEGYYQIILGEQLDGGRYQVFSSLGKGMFSNVVRARILDGEGSEAGKEVAIKIVRAQESM